MVEAGTIFPGLVNESFGPGGGCQGMGMGVGGQDIFIADAIPVAGDPVAPFQPEDQVQFFQVAFDNPGIVEFMPQQFGSHGKIRVGTVHFEDGVAMSLGLFFQ